MAFGELEFVGASVFSFWTLKCPSWAGRFGRCMHSPGGDNKPRSGVVKCVPGSGVRANGSGYMEYTVDGTDTMRAMIAITRGGEKPARGGLGGLRSLWPSHRPRLERLTDGRSGPTSRGADRLGFRRCLLKLADRQPVRGELVAGIGLCRGVDGAVVNLSGRVGGDESKTRHDALGAGGRDLPRELDRASSERSSAGSPGMRLAAHRQKSISSGMPSAMLAVNG